MALERKRSSRRSNYRYQPKKTPGSRCKTCCRKFTAFMFSHVGLCGLVVGYSIMGAFAFRALEAPYEQQKTNEVLNLRQETVNRLWDITYRFNILYKANWTSEVNKEILLFQKQIIKAVKDGYDGSTRQQWSLSRAFLYSLTVITTIDNWQTSLVLQLSAFATQQFPRVLQSPEVTLDVLDSEIRATNQFVVNYQENDFSSACINAKDVTAKLGTLMDFLQVRFRFKKFMFSYEVEDSGQNISTEEKFRTDFFPSLVDNVVSAVTSHFEPISLWRNIFNFVFNKETMTQLHCQRELQNCLNYLLTMGSIDAIELAVELDRFICVVLCNEDLDHEKDFLIHIYKNDLQELYPNLAFTLRTIMADDDQLSDLGVIAIEHEIPRTADYDDLVKQFAEKNPFEKPF